MSDTYQKIAKEIVRLREHIDFLKIIIDNRAKGTFARDTATTIRTMQIVKLYDLEKMVRPSDRKLEAFESRMDAAYEAGEHSRFDRDANR